MATTPFITDAEATQKIQQSYTQLQTQLDAAVFESVKTYDSLTGAQAVDPKPEDGTAFLVSKVTDPNNAGYYTFQSSEPEGTRFERFFSDNFTFDTLQQAQDKWASFSQEKKDALDGKEFTISTGTDAGIYKWDSTQPGGTVLFKKEFITNSKIQEINSSIEKTRRAFEITQDEDTSLYVSTQDLPVSQYGGGNQYGWGFPIGSVNDFQKLRVRLRNADTIALTQINVRVKVDNHNGEILGEKSTSVNLAVGTDGLIETVFDTIINTRNQPIWVEVLTNATVQIFRTGDEAQIFTEDDGYPALGWTNTNDLSGTITSSPSSYMDIYAEVDEISFGLNATQELKDIIVSEIKDAPEESFPENIQEASDISGRLFTKDYDGVQQLVFDSDGAQGQSQTGWGFPIGEVKDFTTVEVYIHYDSAQPLPSIFKAIIKQADHTGNEVARTTTAEFDPITAGKNLVKFIFDAPIGANGLLWLEIFSDGKFGVYRKSSAPEIFTEAAGYPSSRYSNSPIAYDNEEIPMEFNHYDFYAKFNQLQILLTEEGEKTLKVNKPLQGKSLATLGDSITMRFSTQYQDHDTQDWIELQEKLGVSDLINCGIGGSTWRGRGDENITAYPQRAHPSGFAANLVLMLERLVNEGRQSPDMITVLLGTNDGVPDDNYDAVMALTFSQLEVDESIRNTFYGGIRYSLELLIRKFPNAQILLFTPFQSANTSAHRVYSGQLVKAQQIKKMAERYSIPVVDSLHESGIADFFENDLAQGKYLSDGVHLNAAGEELITNYFALKIPQYYFDKPALI